MESHLHVPRATSCAAWTADMCPAHSTSFTTQTFFLSFLGFFLSPPGQWACQNNAYCGEKYWGRGGSCMSTNCAERAAADPDFCAMRMTGCSRTCNCALRGAGGNVTLWTPAPTPAPATTLSGGTDRPLMPAPTTTLVGGTGRPLLLWLHGYSGEASWAKTTWSVDLLAERHGVIVAAPNGETDDLGFPFWNSGATFHGLFADQAHSSSGKASGEDQKRGAYDYTTNTDADHLLEVVKAVRAKHADVSQVYVAGAANGGLMAYYLACRHPDVFAGAIVHGGGQNQEDLDNCRPTSPLHLLAIHGTKDFFPIKSVEKGLSMYADLFGCDNASFPSTDENATAARRMEGVWGGRSLDEYAVGGCMAGGSVTLWRAEDAPHVSNFTAAFPAAISAWLSSRTPRAAAAAPTRVIGLKGLDTLTSLEPAPLPLPPAALALRRTHEPVPDADRVVPF